MNVIRLVQREIHPLTAGLFANWPPDQKVEVGDYGFVSRYQFVRAGSPRAWGLEYEVETIKTINANMEYSVHADIETSAAAKGDVAGTASGTAKIRFGAKGAFLYHLAGLSVQRLADQRKFAGRFMEKYLREAISPDEGPVIVSEVRLAKKSSIVVSDTANAHLELQGNFPVGSGAMLAEVKGGLSLVHSRGTMFKWLAADQTIPLLGLVRPTITGPGGTPLRLGMLEAIRDWISGGRLHIREIRLPVKPIENDGMPVAEAEFSNGVRLEMHFEPVLIDDFEQLSGATAQAEERDWGEPMKFDEVSEEEPGHPLSEEEFLRALFVEHRKPARYVVPGKAEAVDDMIDMIEEIPSSRDAEA